MYCITLHLFVLLRLAQLYLSEIADGQCRSYLS